MNLIERKREEHRGRVFQRVGSVLVCMSLLLAVAFPPQEAKAAFVLDDMAVASVAAVFLASCGMTFAASGMDSRGVAEQVGKVIDSYLQEEFAGQSRMEWIGDAMSAGLSISRGQLSLSSLLSNKLADLARWVQEEYDVKEGQSFFISGHSSYSVPLYNGGSFNFGVFDESTGVRKLVLAGTDLLSFPDGTRFMNETVFNRDVISDKYKFSITNDSCNDKAEFDLSFDYESVYLCFPFYNGYYRFDRLRIIVVKDNTAVRYGDFNYSPLFNDVTELKSNLNIDSGIISIPDTISDDKEVTISTGAASDLTLDQALEQVLAAIAEGQLSATKEIADAGTAADDPAIPGEETIPDIEGLGLPALGAVFTTRFPFSIPWDIARGIKLLAAPAKTPRFEVDFFEPIRYLFGGNLGDTTIVLDFSEYEIIGQVSRWASTIGFCLLLAGGTKRLIWTA